MKKYIMRAPQSPFKNPTHISAIYHDLVSSNSGNLIFVHSIARALMRDGNQIDFTKANKTWSEEEVRRINAEYDAFIIPLANAFRVSFIDQMKVLTKNIKRLNIPCIVVGVGYQGKTDGSIDKNPALDSAVKDFIKAVLKKSNMVGLRGEFTATYLERLGFKPQKHFTVIGCPSMYLYGEDLPKARPFTLNKDTKISLNSKVMLPQKVHNYMHDICTKIEDHIYVVQNTYELKTLYCGMRLTTSSPTVLKDKEFYPFNYKHRLYQENKVRGFINAESWFEYLRGRDLSFGTRIHGNICAVLSGTPAFILACDGRVRELARYHNIQHIALGDLKVKKDIFKLLENADFDSIQKGHAERFNHYLDFMHANELQTIFDEPTVKSDFDEEIKKIDFEKGIVPLPFADYHEQTEALRFWDLTYTDMRAKASR